MKTIMVATANTYPTVESVMKKLDQHVSEMDMDFEKMTRDFGKLLGKRIEHGGSDDRRLNDTEGLWASLSPTKFVFLVIDRQRNYSVFVDDMRDEGPFEGEAHPVSPVFNTKNSVEAFEYFKFKVHTVK